MHKHPGAQHGFHNNSTPRLDESAAKLAWTVRLRTSRSTLVGRSSESSGHPKVRRHRYCCWTGQRRLPLQSGPRGLDIRQSPHHLCTSADRPSPVRAETRDCSKSGARSRWPGASAIGRWGPKSLLKLFILTDRDLVARVMAMVDQSHPRELCTDCRQPAGVHESSTTKAVAGRSTTFSGDG